MPSSRSRTARANHRSGSPPLQAQPLLIRNLGLLPVSLTDLPTDASLVEPLRQDVALLLDDFAAQWASARSQRKGSDGDHPPTADPSSPSPPSSPFALFTQCWIDRGWDLVHFAFADHRDTQARFCESISRVFVEHLAPIATQSHGGGEESACLDTHDALIAVGTVFGLYLLWDTQLFPTSGVGIVHSRRPMETIKIEEDLAQFLLRLPELCAEALQASHSPDPLLCGLEPSSPPVADLTYVLRRLFGYRMRPAPASAQENVADGAQPSRRKDKGKTPLRPATSTPRQANATKHVEAATSIYTLKGQEGNPIFDIIPPSRYATRLPRIFPSSKLMTRMEADRTFQRLARAVAVQNHDTDDDDEGGDDAGGAERRQHGGGEEAVYDREAERAGPGGEDDETRDAVETAVSDRADPSALSESSDSSGDSSAISAKRRKIAHRTVLCGLSRGDLVRLRARERLDLDRAGALDPSIANDPHRPRSDEIKVELPSWIGTNKSTSRLKPWLDNSSGPLEMALGRFSQKREEYEAARRRVLRRQLEASTAGEAQDVTSDRAASLSSGVGEAFDDPPARIDADERVVDYPARLMEHFAGEAADDPTSFVGEGEQVDLESTTPLSLSSIYRLAAKRTSEAIASAREGLDRRTSGT